MRHTIPSYMFGRVIETIPPEYREACSLRYQGLPYSRISRSMGKGPAYAYHICKRAEPMLLNAYQEFLQQDVRNLSIPEKVADILHENQIHTVRDLLEHEDTSPKTTTSSQRLAAAIMEVC